LPGSDLAHAPAGTTSVPIALHRRLFARAPPASARPRPARSRGEGATTLASFATTQNDDESARPGPGTMGTVSDLIGQVATLDAASIGLPWPSRPDVAASISSFQNVIGQAPARRSGRERPTAGRYQIRVSLPRHRSLHELVELFERLTYRAAVGFVTTTSLTIMAAPRRETVDRSLRSTAGSDGSAEVRDFGRSIQLGCCRVN